MNIGKKMYKWAEDLWPIYRSITGKGVRETLKYIQQKIPNLNIFEVPTGVKVFDWFVPNEWNIEEAYIEDDCGNRIVDFSVNNLHIVGYSEPIDRWMSLEELDTHLHSLPDQPDAIPYITSYYKRYWGFCLSHNQRLSLDDVRYHVVINSTLKPGVLNYAEIVIPGREDNEVLLSTYICHPSMANNELSGPVVTIALAHWIMSLNDLKFTYRIIFIPETIGSITYLSKNIFHLKDKVIAGFNITCVGDDLSYSYLPSRGGSSISDMAALHSLKHISPNFNVYTWLDRGSDERQYCSPGVDLPIATIMRSKYGEYPQYHTSLDNLDFITPSGLHGGYTALQRAIDIIEKNEYYETCMPCEPQLGRRGLYPTLSTKVTTLKVQTIVDVISYCDGTLSLLEIAEKINKPFWTLRPIIKKLLKLNIVATISE
jgi:aminopeptidase-like protein